MQGTIVKGVGGFYYIRTEDAGLYECRARGIFRSRGEKPLPGDHVTIEPIDREKMVGNITTILPRYNELIRPAVANVTQGLVVFAAAAPEPNLNLLDNFLVMMAVKKIRTVLVFNKIDLAGQEKLSALADIYSRCGCEILFLSALNREGIGAVQALLPGKITVLAGPSGVGKSSLVNLLIPGAEAETGGLSKKIDRGKNTTRHTELFGTEQDGYLIDTPGFSSFLVEDMEPEQLGKYFPEFAPFEAECRFTGCTHRNEPDCGVKEALERGDISRSRYENYLQIYERLAQRKRY